MNNPDMLFEDAHGDEAEFAEPPSDEPDYEEIVIAAHLRLR
jgi:hypothetical protein